jgi:hypothetical protein
MIGSLTMGAAWGSVATGATVGLLIWCVGLGLRAAVRAVRNWSADQPRRAWLRELRRCRRRASRLRQRPYQQKDHESV